MKHRIFLFIAVIALSLSVAAQGPGGQRRGFGPGEGGQRMEFSPENFIKELKGFVTREAQLTPDEANKFFPLFFEMHEKTRKIQETQRDLIIKSMRCDENKMSESDYAKIVDQLTKLEVSSKEVEHAYYKKFHTVLSWKKVYKVRNAINRFHMYALSRYQGRNTMNRNQPPRPQ
ncbi:MAG: hypothetical protein KBT29_10345 [Prevotellaceae bacterium]|nr:hypothetical protein [Candidatus Minthosoma caballi]